MVLWLLVSQRLQGGSPLGAAVLELLRGLPDSFWPNPCKRVQDWRKGTAPSSYTGAYNQARQALPLPVVERSCDRIFEQLFARLNPTVPPLPRRTFLVDGSSLRMAHTAALCNRYPAGSNQHGEGHWPVLKVLVAHDLQTGLAIRPEWGPMYGPEAVSEQYLLERLSGRLPEGSTILGDINFGIFWVVWQAMQLNHSVVLRLSTVRAKKLAGGKLRDGIDRAVGWRASAHDRKAHTLPAGAQLKGRLIVQRVRPSAGKRPFLLALFTTLPDPQPEILELYGQRWNIETDIRTLKGNLRLGQLTCTSPEMVAKEIEMAIAAYNLVRGVSCLAAEQSGMDPRRYSFTQVQQIVQTFAPALAAAADEREAQRIFDHMMDCVRQAKLPRRKRPTYPRAVWGEGGKFPKRKA